MRGERMRIHRTDISSGVLKDFGWCPFLTAKSLRTSTSGSIIVFRGSILVDKTDIVCRKGSKLDFVLFFVYIIDPFRSPASHFKARILHCTSSISDLTPYG